jgi:hypothetical protein
MRLRLGLHLDGQRGWRAANRLGEATLGPLGFLTLLETQLGLTRLLDSQAQRIVQYRDCLARINTPERFYHRSFEADDFGTAATLLDWRDQWQVHGWSGHLNSTTSRRLNDLGDVEVLARASVSPSIAERLSLVVETLGIRNVQIEDVELLDPPAAFPKLWQQVFSRLPVREVDLPNESRSDGFLAELQQAIRRAQTNEQVSPLPWQDDGSVVVVRAETMMLGGRWIAQALDHAEADALLVATSEGGLFDSIGTASDRPRQGLCETSAFRPAQQVLPLVLELIWQPLNFYALIQFLTHPICPIRGYARRQLAAKQSDHPGIGGPRWDAVLNEIDTHFGEQAPGVRQSIRTWIENPRYPQDAGAPISTIFERVSQLADFFSNGLGDDDPALRSAYHAGFAQCQACAEALGRLMAQGVERLRPRQLQQLVGQATARGSDNPLLTSQVGAVPCVTHPGAAIASFDEVIWWPLEAPALPSAYPWSASEIAALKESGVDLPPVHEVLERTAAEWTRPLLAARHRLVLVLPPDTREAHPVWQMLQALTTDLPVRPLEAVLQGNGAGLNPLPHTPLPQRRRWWQLPPGTPLPPPAAYSYTSLERRLFNPYHWLLTYPAQLRPSNILSLTDDFRLKGLLAHSLVERFYQRKDGLAMTDAQFAAWFDPAFDELVEEEGAIYLMPGRRTDRENVRLALRRAMRELRERVRASGATKVSPEHRFSGHFTGGALQGTSDLVLTRADRSQAVIDMKWAGNTHRERLEKNRHLQLAIYAELLRQETRRWPEVGYFLLSTAQLYVRDDLFFPDVQPVKLKTAEGTAELWQRFLATWGWREQQLAEGRIEVVLESSDEPESIPPDDALTIEPLNQGYNECLTLAGWEE